MTNPAAPVHDMALFAALLRMARTDFPAVREGRMFGSPAIYSGNKMALCVFGSRIGLKIPEALTRECLAQCDVQPFRPYGKPAMLEWVEISCPAEALDQQEELIFAALRYAEKPDGGASEKPC